jgi:hypothetical protein
MNWSKFVKIEREIGSERQGDVSRMKRSYRSFENVVRSWKKSATMDMV